MMPGRSSWVTENNDHWICPAVCFDDSVSEFRGFFSVVKATAADAIIAVGTAKRSGAVIRAIWCVERLQLRQRNAHCRRGGLSMSCWEASVRSRERLETQPWTSKVVGVVRLWVLP